MSGNKKKYPWNKGNQKDPGGMTEVYAGPMPIPDEPEEDDPRMMEAGVGMLKLYFVGFVFMSFQFAGQSTFQALGDARHAVFFSLLRKVIIVTPLTLLLPRLGLGTDGVFLAEPVSNFLGGMAAFITMYLTVYRKLREEEQGEKD